MVRKLREVEGLTKEEVIEIAKEECEKIGFEFMDIKELPNKADNYLRYVIGYNANKEEFGTWMMNLEMGGLYYGHYINHWFESKEIALDKAWKDFLER